MSEHKTATYPRMEWTPERISRFWDYEAQFPEKYFTYGNGYNMVTLLEPFLKGSRGVLDFACGAGHLMQHLMDRGYKVAGVEFSTRALETVRSRFEGSPLFLGALALDQADNTDSTFDTIFACEVIEHLDDALLEDFAGRLHNLAKQDTRIIITTPNSEDLAASDIYCPACNHVFHRWQHLRSWSPHSLANFLENRGFQVEKVFATNFKLAEHDLKSAYHKWKALRKKRRNIEKGKTSGPHLVAVARRA
jgi:2-polyprenyl-3-methyl-5-hydroxy-6-metoxy-1,4-benzoquinol methylase